MKLVHQFKVEVQGLMEGLYHLCMEWHLYINWVFSFNLAIYCIWCIKSFPTFSMKSVWEKKNNNNIFQSFPFRAEALKRFPQHIAPFRQPFLVSGYGLPGENLQFKILNHRRGLSDQEERRRQRLLRKEQKMLRRAQRQEERQLRRSQRRGKKKKSCNGRSMKCFSHDNDHWKTPPYWDCKSSVTQSVQSVTHQSVNNPLISQSVLPVSQASSWSVNQ